MYGQNNNQYGYQPQYGGYQQQGGYPPQQQQPQLTAEQMLDRIDSQSSKSAFNADSQPGAMVTGVIESVTATQVRDFQTKQLTYWDDGSPRLQILVTVDTGVRDPNVEDDDGRRTVYIKGWGVQRRAWLTALRNAGLKKTHDVRPGDRFTATFTGYGPRGNAPQPPKLFEYAIEHQSAADVAMHGPEGVQNGPQADYRQQGGQSYGQQPNGFQQAQPAPNQGYQQQGDPWNPQGGQQGARQPAGPDPMKVMQLKGLGKPPQEIARLLGCTVEQVTAITDKVTGQGSEDDPAF